jgi:two-component system NarL family sensor kinase
MRDLSSIIYILVTLQCLPVYSQSNIPDSARIAQLAARKLHADSANSALHQMPRDTDKARRMIEVSGLYAGVVPDSALLLALNAENLCRELDFPAGLSAAYYVHGEVMELAGDRDAALFFFKQAIEVAEKHNLLEELYRYYSGIFNSYYYMGKFPEAMDVAHKGLQMAERRNDQLRIMGYTNMIGNTFFRQNELGEASRYYEKALAIAEKLKLEESIANASVNLAEIYILRKDSSRMFHYLNRALKLYRDNFDSPAFFGRRHRYAYVLYKTAEAYDTLGHKDTALALSLQALEVCQTRVSCDPFDMVNYYLQTGNLYLERSDHKKAKSYFITAMLVALRINHKENSRDTYKALALVYEAEKNYDSAYYFFKLFTQFKDEITNKESQAAITRIQGEYDTAEKDRVIARQHNLRNIFIGGFIFFLLSAGFLYNRYRLRQHNKYQEQQNRQQNELFNAIALAQEQERKRIAQDIHDSLGSVLSAAKLKMAEVKDNKPELATDEKFTAGISLLDEASAELRLISHNIMPATLSKLGLVPALRNLTEKISSHKGLQVQFIAHDLSNRLQEQTEISVYRIVLELINNVVKHASANKATVQLVRFPEYLSITVEDNGIGFDPPHIADEKTGIGIANITARVDYLKGRIDIDSIPGKGTTVMIEIPLG